MQLPRVLYGIYEKRLLRSLNLAQLPRHIGVILDGNRRWAKSFGESAATGHQRGADKITELLSWSGELDIEVVTLWMLSIDNLRRDPSELRDLMGIIEDAVDRLAAAGQWRINIVGKLDLLPESTAERLRAAAERTEAVTAGTQVNVAVGYGGRDEITDAVRSLLKEAAAQGKTLDDLATTVTTDDIADHLYLPGQPDPELIIRTSGEMRLGGFLLWQSSHSEYYFCEAYWPDFRKVDFLRALRSYAARERRLGK